MARVIVDADVYAYAAGGATQRTVYDWLVADEETILDSGIAASKEELREIASLIPDGARLETTEIVEAEPLSHALALVKRSLLGVEEAMDAEGVEFDKLELYLTGKGNFREQVATIKGYKANRKDNVRPVHYKGIRRYMMERWGATVVRGYEADDALAMRAHEHGYDPQAVVLVSQDKDLRTVPGRHYNPRKKAWSVVTKQEALLNFYGQVLTGDPVDNIGGVYKMGPKGAAELLVGLNDAAEEALARAVLLAYEQSLAKKGCPYTDPEAAMLENCRLLHMARTIEETTTAMWRFPWDRG
jgi:DNA polymerase-1